MLITIFPGDVYPACLEFDTGNGILLEYSCKLCGRKDEAYPDDPILDTDDKGVKTCPRYFELMYGCHDEKCNCKTGKIIRQVID